MKRSQRMQSVLALAEQRELDALGQLAKARQRVQEAEDKLRQLCDYRAEYDVRDQVVGQALDLVRLQASRHFLGRLDDAIRQQREEVGRLDRQVESSRQGWVQARHHRDSMKELAGRYRREEQEQADRQEQARADDMSGQRLIWRRRESAEEA